MGKVSERLRVRANFHARRAPAASRDMKEAADLLDECEKALRELMAALPIDAKPYLVGPASAAAYKRAAECVAKLEGGK